MQRDFEIIQQLEKLLNLDGFVRGRVDVQHSVSGKIQSVSIVAVTKIYDKLDPAMLELFVPSVDEFCGPCAEFKELFESLGNAT